MTFLDTSAICALAGRTDPNYQAAERCFRALVEAGEEILAHNYVLVESFALLHHRLGLAAALRLAESCRAFVVKWIDRDLHNEAMAELARTRRRAVSLVDEVSFLVMREGECKKRWFLARILSAPDFGSSDDDAKSVPGRPSHPLWTAL